VKSLNKILELHHKENDAEVLKKYIAQYVLWIKDYFGIDQRGVVTNFKAMSQFLKSGYCEINENNESCWQLTKAFEDVDANRRLIIRTTFVLSDIYE